MLEAWGGIRAVPIRKLIGLLGAIVALITAVCPPLSYAVNGYLREQAALTFRAETTAARAAGLIRATSTDWRLEPENLARATNIRSLTATPVVQRILSSSGNIVVQRLEPLTGPTTFVAAPIVVGGAAVGRVEVIGSLRPLVIEVAFLSLVTLGLGIAAYFAFTVLPIRALDRSMGDLEVANARFKEQNLLLDTALTHMHQGLAMFDADERLVFANDRCAALYGIAPDQLAQGTSLQQLAQYRIASGLHVGLTADEVVKTVRKQVASGKVSHFSRTLSDGRTLAVTIRPRPDGGWVTTHEDVTEHVRLNARLAEQNERLRRQEKEFKAQNLILDAALETMSQGLCMFDAEPAARDLQFALCRDVRPDPGAGETRHDAAADRGASHRQRRSTSALRPRITCASGSRRSSDASNTIHELSDGRSIAIARRPTPGGGWVTTHEDITEQRRKEAKIAHMALHDALTDLPNRVLLNERLEHGLARARHGELGRLPPPRSRPLQERQRHARPSAPATSCCSQVADRLRALVREADTIARMGGDEFAIVQAALAAAGRRHHAGPARHRGGQRALRHRRPPGGDRHQHRHRHGAGRRRVTPTS